MKWIQHDTDANQDAKLQNVLLDYGLEGYGLYWYCIELIAGKVDKDHITFELEHDARIIARNTGSTPQKVEEMMRYLVKEGLFESSEGVITCFKLAKRLTQSMTSNPQMRSIIEGFKSHDEIMTESQIVMQDQITLDDITLEENKDIPAPSRFSEFWDLYGKKVDSKKCEAKFKKLSKADIEALFAKLADYIKSTPDKQYRKNPITWLNGKYWNDEVQKTMVIETCGLDYALLVSDFNEAMANHADVPEAIKITEAQQQKLSPIANEYKMTNERFKGYFNHCATSDKFSFMIEGVGMPAQGINYFLKEETLLKGME